MPRTPQYNQPAPPGYVWADEASRLTGRAVETLYKDRQKKPEDNPGPESVTFSRKAAWSLEAIKAWLEQGSNPKPDTERQAENRPPEPRRPRKTSRPHAAKRTTASYKPAA